VNERGFATPTIKFNLVYSLIHIYRHLFDEGIGLRQMMDYYYIMQHSIETERSEAYRALCNLGMKRFVSAAMYVMVGVYSMNQQYLLCEPSEKYGTKLLNSILEGGNFGHYNNKNAHGKENRIQRGIRNIRHNLSVLSDYPSEVLWSPIWKCWHWCWRKWNGYL